MTSLYVSRGGEKLQAAFEYFNINPSGLVALDIGSSTGGFSHCLILGGAEKVFAVDVGYGQLAWELQKDSACGFTGANKFSSSRSLNVLVKL